MIEKRKWYPYEIERLGLDKNMGIDYDKLTNAIVNALKIVNEPQSKPQKQCPQFSLKLVVQTLWRIMRGKIDTNGEMTVGVFAILIASMFRIFSLVCFIFAGVFGYFFVTAARNANWIGFQIATNIGEIVVALVIIIASLLYAFILWVASNEMMKEKDKGFIVGVFSGVVALAALVVSLIQLLGVG